MIKKILALAAISFVIMAAAPPHANRGNAKTHVPHTTGDTAPPVTRNYPHLGCDFHIHGFDFSSDTSWTITSWPPTGSKKVVLSGSGVITPEYSLADGHYRLDTTNPNKHKMFWVKCASVTPPQTPSPTSASGEVNRIVSKPTMPPTDLGLVRSTGNTSILWLIPMFIMTLIGLFIRR